MYDEQHPRPRSRDRHGRGRPGPDVVPPVGYRVGTTSGLGDQRLLAARIPARRTRKERFDMIATSVMADIESRWRSQLSFVELAVEDVPVLPPSWASDRVPMASLVAGTSTSPPRVVLFRQPIELRADTREDLEALLLTCLVEQVAGFLGIDPEDVHPGYQSDD